MIPRALFLHPLQQCSMSFIALHQKDTAILQTSPNHSSVNVDKVLAGKPCLARKVRKWSRLEAFLTCSMWGHSLGESLDTWWWSRLGQILSSADFSCNWAACFFCCSQCIQLQGFHWSVTMNVRYGNGPRPNTQCQMCCPRQSFKWMCRRERYGKEVSHQLQGVLDKFHEHRICSQCEWGQGLDL